MENNKLIAEALLDLAKLSETTFIEVAEDKELIDAAKKLGIVLPSPDLAVLKTVYAEIDKVNRNGVILPKNAVKKGLPTLIGKQINWEHDGAGRICGYIIDAKIKEDKIEIIGVVFKSLFPEEMEEVKDKFIDKKLAVSFEIWTRTEDGESVVHELENGFRSLDPITFHGCGLLVMNQPACPKAIVYKLLASKELENAEKIVDNIFEENLICASMAIDEPKCKNCTSCTCKKEAEIVEEVKLEEIVSERICPECQQPLKEDETDLCAVCLKKKEDEKNKSSEETQVIVTPAETKTEEKSEVAETKTEEIIAEETKEEIVEVKEEASVVIQTQEVITTDELQPDAEVITTEIKTETTSKDDSGAVTMVVVREEKIVETYTRRQLDEEVKVAQEEIVAAMPKEVSDRIKELMKDGKSMKEAMKQAWDEYKKSQEKALEEKDVEIKNKNTELEQKTQEIAKLTVVEEPKTEKIMTVGSVETEKISETKKQANKINEIIASKRNQ
jgi:urease gamma subunit